MKRARRLLGVLPCLLLPLVGCSSSGTSPPPSGVGGSAGLGGASAGGKGGAGGKAGAPTGGQAGQGGVSGTSGQSGQGGQGGEGGQGGVAGAQGGESGQGGQAGGPVCTAGTVTCDGLTSRVCDGQGGFQDPKTCAKLCIEGLGCAECMPNEGSCEGSKATRCKADGSGFETTECDAELGLSCLPGVGQCDGACAPASLVRSYIGCEYFPTVTSNGELFSGFSFAIVVGNTSDEEATVTVRRGTQLITTATVGAKSVQTVKLPWVEELRNPRQGLSEQAAEQALMSEVVTGGAYHVKSTRPVTIYQFNPLEFQIPDSSSCPKPLGSNQCNSYTNDASLLLPVNALGTDYLVTSAAPLISAAPSLGSKKYQQIPGLLTVTATEDGTSVTVVSSANVRAGSGVQAMAPNGSQTFALNRGDVVQLLAGKAPDSAIQNCQNQLGGGQYCTAGKEYDLTGTQVTSTRPVLVLGGHDCLRTPYNKSACDHVEETMFPLNTLGNEVIVTAPQAVKSAASGDGKPDQYLVRVMSAVDGNTLVLDPPIAPGGTLNKGQYADVPLTDKDLLVKGTGPLLVAQFMLSADQVDPASSGSASSQGDPSLSLGIPSAQYRTDYTFLAPESYTQNFVNIVAVKGSTVMLDDQPITMDGPAIGSSTFTVLRKKISGGPHRATSMEPFGIVVYGYGLYTSYMVPGGLNLTKL